MTSAPESSGPGLPEEVEELASTLTLDVEATIRADMAGAIAEPLLVETLPRVDVGGGAAAELQPGVLLGKGGMGEVRLARQKGLGRDVALKTVSKPHSSELSTALLLQEGVITGRLEHPNIVPVYMMVRGPDDRPIIVMKRIEGLPWSELDVETSQTTVWSSDPIMRHLEVFLEVCNAVAFAHDRGFVHRDIKPSNVMIGSFGEVYLLDWGIATAVGTCAYDHTKNGAACVPLGTPVYMAPEMCRQSGVIDERTDVYLLGATLHGVLTGSPRHRAKNLPSTLIAAAISEPYPYASEIPEELAVICNRATARSPSARYQDVGELRDAVVEYLRHKGSLDLAREGEAMLEALVQAVAAEAASSDVRRRFAECRFAFVRALKDWGENQRAASGLQRCLRTMAREELRLDQLDAAQALLDQLPEPDEDLQRQLDAMRAEQAIDDERVASLRKLARDLDPTVSRAPRAALVVTFALLVVFTLWGMTREPPLFAYTPRGAIVMMVPFVVLYLVAAIVLRRPLFGTLFNRRIMILVGMGILAMTVNRALAVIAQPSFPYMLGVDLFLIAVIAAAGGATLERTLYAPALIWLLGAIGIIMLPDFALVPYAISQIGGLVVMGWVFYRSRRTS